MLPVEVGRIAESVILGQATAPVILVGLTMQLVGAGFRDHVKQSAGGTPKFGSEAIGYDLEFLHSFDRHCQVLGFQ